MGTKVLYVTTRILMLNKYEMRTMCVVLVHFTFNENPEKLLLLLILITFEK